MDGQSADQRLGEGGLAVATRPPTTEVPTGVGRLQMPQVGAHQGTATQLQNNAEHHTRRHDQHSTTTQRQREQADEVSTTQDADAVDDGGYTHLHTLGPTKKARAAPHLRVDPDGVARARPGHHRASIQEVLHIQCKECTEDDILFEDVVQQNAPTAARPDTKSDDDDDDDDNDDDLFYADVECPWSRGTILDALDSDTETEDFDGFDPVSV